MDNYWAPRVNMGPLKYLKLKKKNHIIFYLPPTSSLPSFLCNPPPTLPPFSPLQPAPPTLLHLFCNPHHLPRTNGTTHLPIQNHSINRTLTLTPKNSHHPHIFFSRFFPLFFSLSESEQQKTHAHSNYRFPGSNLTPNKKNKKQKTKEKKWDSLFLSVLRFPLLPLPRTFVHSFRHYDHCLLRACWNFQLLPIGILQFGVVFGNCEVFCSNSEKGFLYRLWCR